MSNPAMRRLAKVPAFLSRPARREPAASAAGVTRMRDAEEEEVTRARQTLAIARERVTEWELTGDPVYSAAVRHLDNALRCHDSVIADNETGLGSWHAACVRTAEAAARAARTVVSFVRMERGDAAAAVFGPGQEGKP